MVKLGEKYRDGITGFLGTATGRAEYLHGCVQVLLEAGEDGEAKSKWFDEPRLLLATSGKPVDSPATAGGPMPAPPGRNPR